MRKLSIIFLALWGLLLGCDKNTLQNDLTVPSDEAVNAKMVLSPLMNYRLPENLTAPAAQFRDNAVSRPLKINKVSGTLAFFPNSESCDGYIKVEGRGNGTGTHLGAFTQEIDYCTDGVNPTSNIFSISTAANGDKLFSVMVGAGPDYQDYYYYGGTGRFEGAYGEIRLYGYVDYVNLVWSLQGEGYLVY